MGIARLAMTNPRAFALGVTIGALLIGSGFLLALAATGQAGATHDDSSTYHACVSKYTGATRIMPPGQPPNCTSTEFLVELGAGDPAENLTYTVRTETTDPSTVIILGSEQVDCSAGETAVNGGSRLIFGGQVLNSSSFKLSGSGPVGSPPTGWLSVFVIDGIIGTPPVPGTLLVETWVLCVS